MANLTNALQQQIELLDKLKAQLSQEADLIVGRDADSLMLLVSEKEKVLDEINSNDALIKASNDVEFLTEEQANLAEQGKTLLKECQRLTDINARIVEKNQIRVQRLRNIMIATRNKESLTYTNKGKTHGGLLGGGIKA